MTSTQPTPPTCNCGPGCTWPECELTCEGRDRMDKVHKAERMAAAKPVLVAREWQFDAQKAGGSLGIWRDGQWLSLSRATAEHNALVARLREVERLAEFWEQNSVEWSIKFESLRAQLAAAVEALREWADYGRLHVSFCPEDDTCDCRIAKLVNAVLAPAQGKGATDGER